VIGQTVGNFEIVSQLGRGGMGEVWLAQQKTLKTKAAIKILAAGISNNAQHVARFHNEALAVSQIPHSGIVKIFDSGMLGGRAYLVMEYLQGETLASRIKRMGQLELTQLCDFGRQIASVLDATHGAGITHRDLKPENIFLVRDAEMVQGERVKVLDFGIAKLDAAIGPRMTAIGASSIGTPNYMSPEQWHSLAEADWRTDAYALGCVAFEMACGRPPFIAESRVEICAMHLETPPPPASSLRRGLPLPFDIMVSRLLAKEPTMRPSMREVMGVFTALGEQAGIMLSTLRPGTKVSSDSMGFRVTPQAGFASQTDLPVTRDHDDATPVADMSLQFRVTPRAGWPSQTDMPVMNSRGASQGMEMSAMKRWPWLVIAGICVVAITAVIAIVATRKPALAVLPDAAVITPDASVAIVIDAAVPPRPPPVKQLPPRIEPAQMPELTASLDVIVCITEAGEVDDVRLANGATPDNAIEAKVLTWSYQAGTKMCGPVTLPAAAAAEGVLPERLTQKLFDHGVGAVQEAIFECAVHGEGAFSVEVVVSPAGVGKLKSLAGAINPRLRKCITAAVAEAVFAKTRLGGKGKTTVELGG